MSGGIDQIFLVALEVIATVATSHTCDDFHFRTGEFASENFTKLKTH